MTGIVLAGIGVGTMVMPLVASWLISSYDWHISYIVLGSIVLVLVMLPAQFLKRDPSRVGLLPYGAGKMSEEALSLEVGGLSLREAIHTWQFWIFCVIWLSWNFGLQTIWVHIVPRGCFAQCSSVLVSVYKLSWCTLYLMLLIWGFHQLAQPAF